MNWYRSSKNKQAVASRIDFRSHPGYQKFISGPPPVKYKEINGQPLAVWGDEESMKWQQNATLFAQSIAEQIASGYDAFIRKSFQDLTGDLPLTRYLWSKVSHDIINSVLEAEGLDDIFSNRSNPALEADGIIEKSDKDKREKQIDFLIRMELGPEVNSKVYELLKEKYGFDPGDPSTNHLIKEDGRGYYPSEEDMKKEQERKNLFKDE